MRRRDLRLPWLLLWVSAACARAAPRPSPNPAPAFVAPAAGPPAAADLPAPLPSPDETSATGPADVRKEGERAARQPDGGEGSVGEADPPGPNDLEEFLYAHRINFAAGGAPLVTVRLMEGQDQIDLEGDAPLDVLLHGTPSDEAKHVGAPAHKLLRIRLKESTPGALRDYPQVGDFKLSDHDGIEAAKALWQGRGFDVELRTIGTVYGVAGRVLDNRRVLVLLGEGGDGDTAETILSQVREAYGEAGDLYEELMRRPSGTLEVQDESGAVVAASHDLVAVDSGGDVLVHRVEYGVGYAFHGFQDRRYHGRLFAVVDKLGKLALVEAVPLEDLLRGLVPAEMFASAPAEALKAQAVTARGEVLAKIGARHLADPYVLCAEQHCQVYGGLGSERPATDRTVAATRGEALFGPTGRLVDSVYSAVCGGHTEDNEVVWGGPPDETLRGVSDLVEGPAERTTGNLRDEAQLRRYLDRMPQSYCWLSGAAAPSKLRWAKTFASADLDALLAPLGVGHVLHLTPRDRGASGRAATLVVQGDGGQAEVHGELRIRRLLRNLNSSAFVVDERMAAGGRGIEAFVLHGAGWGHGVGMCQTGAIGRAKAGQDHREILRHYFNGAEITKIY